MQCGLGTLDRNPELWMLRRINTWWFRDQLMVNKEPIWHGALWRNGQNERLWPAKWGSDHRGTTSGMSVCLRVSHPRWQPLINARLPPLSLPPSLLPPVLQLPHWCVQGLLAHGPCVLVSTMQTAPVQGHALLANWQRQIVQIQEWMGVCTTATLSEGWSKENMQHLYILYTLVFIGADAVNLLGASSPRPFSFSSTSMAEVNGEASRSC